MHTHMHSLSHMELEMRKKERHRCRCRCECRCKLSFSVTGKDRCRQGSFFLDPDRSTNCINFFYNVQRGIDGYKEI